MLEGTFFSGCVYVCLCGFKDNILCFIEGTPILVVVWGRLDK